MDIVTRQKLIVLIQLAKADHHFAKAEKQLIRQVAEKNNFPAKELAELMEGTPTIESLGALSSERKREYLLDCLRMVMADGKIEPQEITFSQNIAVKLGFHKDVVPEALENWPDIENVDYSLYRLT